MTYIHTQSLPTMPSPTLHRVYLRSDFSLFDLLNICSRFFGIAFLQDIEHPCIGIAPKKYWTNQSSLCCFTRQEDFSYIPSTEPLAFAFTQQYECDMQGFNGGFICFISYDYAVTSQLNKQQHLTQPALLIGEYDVFIKKIENQWVLHIDSSLMHLKYIQNLIHTLSSQLTCASLPTCKFDTAFQPRWSKSEYQQAFNKVQQYLYAGDCYQINLTQEFNATLKSGHLMSLLPELLQLSKAPFSGYISYQNFELLSCSPELFIEFNKNKSLITRPIKGTLPRHQDPIEDAKLKQCLAESQKDQAENLMIVDLLRNDLSVYAEIGSVKVPKLFEIESFAQVHHMVSEIHATLKPEINPFDVLLSALPGGSITGAPKIRAMEIIDEIEGNSRGAYCGSLGYFNYDGTGRFNILIRSIQRYGDHVSIWAGGGITVASNVDAEYQESLDKVSAILNVLNQYAENL